MQKRNPGWWSSDSEVTQPVLPSAFPTPPWSSCPVCCPSGFCTTKSHKSVSPGQELVGFSSKMPTASQWTKKNSPICPICFSSCTFTSSTSTKSGGTFHPLSPYPCHRTSARAGPSDPEYTHACSISCPNKSSDWSGICLAYHCIPITSTDHAVGA